MSGSIVKLDLRVMSVLERHPRIFDEWEQLPAEGVHQIVNDHDPKPLHYQFEGEFSGKFIWDYIEKGPKDWVVNITKLKPYEAKGEELRLKVIDALSNVRPHLQADGGDVELVDIDEAAMIVKVKLTGACNGCPSAAMTLKSGVEHTIKKFAPEIKGVEAVNREP